MRRGYKHKDLVEASALGDLERLKKYAKLGLFDTIYDVKMAVYYCTRSCSISCVDYLISNSDISLEELFANRNLVWEMYGRKDISSYVRMEMLTYLYDKGLTDILSQLATYCFLNKDNELFDSMLIKFNTLENYELILHISREYKNTMFQTLIQQKIRETKIDSIL